MSDIFSPFAFAIAVFAMLIAIDNHPPVTSQTGHVTIITIKQKPLDAGIQVQLDACRKRTDDLRFALDTLIKIYPYRARLPGPAADWEPWPKVGGHYGSINDPDMRGWK